MAVVLRANAKAVPPVSNGNVSALHGGVVSGSATGVDDLGTAYFVLGSTPSGTPPAQYGDLTGLLEGKLTELRGTLQTAYDNGSGTWSVTFNMPVANSVVSNADHLWFALFSPAGATPDPTDAPDAVSTQFRGIE